MCQLMKGNIDLSGIMQILVFILLSAFWLRKDLPNLICMSLFELVCYIASCHFGVTLQWRSQVWKLLSCPARV